MKVYSTGSSTDRKLAEFGLEQDKFQTATDLKRQELGMNNATTQRGQDPGYDATFKGLKPGLDELSQSGGGTAWGDNPSTGAATNSNSQVFKSGNSYSQFPSAGSTDMGLGRSSPGGLAGSNFDQNQIEQVKRQADTALAGIGSYFAGGKVKGPPPPAPDVDNIPAMLQANEYVLRPEVVEALGGVEYLDELTEKVTGQRPVPGGTPTPEGKPGFSKSGAAMTEEEMRAAAYAPNRPPDPPPVQPSYSLGNLAAETAQSATQKTGNAIADLASRVSSSNDRATQNARTAFANGDDLLQRIGSWAGRAADRNTPRTQQALMEGMRAFKGAPTTATAINQGLRAAWNTSLGLVKDAVVPVSRGIKDTGLELLTGKPTPHGTPPAPGNSAESSGAAAPVAPPPTFQDPAEWGKRQRAMLDEQERTRGYAAAKQGMDPVSVRPDDTAYRTGLSEGRQSRQNNSQWQSMVGRNYAGDINNMNKPPPSPLESLGQTVSEITRLARQNGYPPSVAKELVIEALKQQKPEGLSAQDYVAMQRLDLDREQYGLQQADRGLNRTKAERDYERQLLDQYLPTSSEGSADTAKQRAWVGAAYNRLAPITRKPPQELYPLLAQAALLPQNGESDAVYAKRQEAFLRDQLGIDFGGAR